MQIWGRGSTKPIAFTSPFQGLLLQLLQEEELWAGTLVRQHGRLGNAFNLQMHSWMGMINLGGLICYWLLSARFWEQWFNDEQCLQLQVWAHHFVLIAWTCCTSSQYRCIFDFLHLPTPRQDMHLPYSAPTTPTGWAAPTPLVIGVVAATDKTAAGGWVEMIIGAAAMASISACLYEVSVWSWCIPWEIKLIQIIFIQDHSWFIVIIWSGMFGVFGAFVPPVISPSRSDASWPVSNCGAGKRHSFCPREMQAEEVTVSRSEACVPCSKAQQG